MCRHCTTGCVASDVEVIPIQQINEAFERVLRSDVRYRFVIDMASLRESTTEGTSTGARRRLTAHNARPTGYRPLMRSSIPHGRSLAAVALLLQGGCALVSDLGFEEATSSTGATATATGTGSGTTSGTGASTASGTGGAGQGAAGPGGSGPGGSGPGGAGGSGAGGAPGCTFEDAGADASAPPWSITLGPLGSPVGLAPGMAVAPSEDRVAFAMPAEVASSPLPVLLDGRAVTGGESAAFVIGWVDDGGAASDAWPLAGAAPIAGVYNPVDIAALDGGRALVAVGGSTAGALVVEVDLCTQAQSPPLLQCERGVQDIAIDASLEGRLVVAISVDPGVSCSILPPGCVLPQGIGSVDTVLFHMTVTGACSVGLLHSDEEGTGTPPLMFQNGVRPALADGDAIVVTGVFDGSLFADSSAIDTGEPAFYEDGPDPDTNPDQAISAFHRFHASFEVDGDSLTVIDAAELGRIAFAAGSHGVVWRDGGALVFGGSEGSVLPLGPFETSVSPTARGFLDIQLGLFPTPSTPEFLTWSGGGSADFPSAVIATPTGMMLSGWVTSIDGAPLGSCSDPFVATKNGGLVGGGCATFSRLSDAGVITDAFLVDAEEKGGADYGLAALALPGGGSIVVGYTDGTIELDRVINAPPEGAGHIYFARRD